MLSAPTSNDPTFPVSRPPPRIGTSTPDWSPMRAAEEQLRRVAPPAAAPAPAAAERELVDRAALEEELALLREVELEAGQVDLLLVGLDLGEVGVRR
jgi:hypothetical protein